MDYEHNYYVKLVSGTIAFSLFFVALCVCTLVFLPAEKASENTAFSDGSAAENSAENTVNYESLFDQEYPELVIENKKKNDAGLVLYKQPQSRAAVEWYYSRVANSREVAQAVLQSAEEFDIPLSLAFALAHTESNFKVTAMHKNTNGSIDRGLFQLNSTSFPKLEESDFYDPKISAHYGLAHLRFCLNTAGNEIAALAMYNAGANKVRKNNTPQITLDYISKIQNYKHDLEDNFATEVLALYTTETQKNLLAKKF
ncbi:transglycosylase SLT domain-containing protein [Treponema sp.]|uniref:transglycosylase SLT domain-containing protein n=1 Tax=Treponema sp. TaxID=166 RepID=UPI003F0A1DB1